MNEDYFGSWDVLGATIQGPCPLAVGGQRIEIRGTVTRLEILWPCGDVHSAKFVGDEIAGTVSYNDNSACAGEGGCQNLSFTFVLLNDREHLKCELFFQAEGDVVTDAGSWTAQGGGG